MCPHALLICFDTSNDQDSILGLQFENLVLNNIEKLLPLLALSGVTILAAAPYRKKGRLADNGAQIDLLIQTKRTLYVVEIKRRKYIGTEIVSEMAEKVKRLHVPSSHSIRTALVYDGELTPTIRTDGCFDFLVSAEQLFTARL